MVVIVAIIRVSKKPRCVDEERTFSWPPHGIAHLGVESIVSKGISFGNSKIYISFGNMGLYNMNAMKPNEIKRIRKILGITQRELAERIGVTLNTVGRWECGARPCTGTAAMLLRHLEKESRHAFAS